MNYHRVVFEIRGGTDLRQQLRYAQDLMEWFDGSLEDSTYKITSHVELVSEEAHDD